MDGADEECARSLSVERDRERFKIAIVAGVPEVAQIATPDDATTLYGHRICISITIKLNGIFKIVCKSVARLSGHRRRN
jgi:hypothetical protein